jgi:hypothetical protein
MAVSPIQAIMHMHIYPSADCQSMDLLAVPSEIVVQLLSFMRWIVKPYQAVCTSQKIGASQPSHAEEQKIGEERASRNHTEEIKR